MHGRGGGSRADAQQGRVPGRSLPSRCPASSNLQDTIVLPARIYAEALVATAAQDEEGSKSWEAGSGHQALSHRCPKGHSPRTVSHHCQRGGKVSLPPTPAVRNGPAVPVCSGMA